MYTFFTEMEILKRIVAFTSSLFQDMKLQKKKSSIGIISQKFGDDIVLSFLKELFPSSGIQLSLLFQELFFFLLLTSKEKIVFDDWVAVHADFCVQCFRKGFPGNNFVDEFRRFLKKYL